MAVPLRGAAAVGLSSGGGPGIDNLHLDTLRLGPCAYVAARFWDQVSRRQLGRLRQLLRGGDTPADEVLARLGACQGRGEEGGHAVSVLELDQALVLATYDRSNDRWHFVVAGRTDAALDAASARVEAALPERPAPPDDQVVLRFWSLNGAGDPDWFSRSLTTPRWDDIAGNYPVVTRRHLDRLRSIERPASDGKLVLLHGPPGTGKTTYIRTLLRSWRTWADPAYIVDPERFFAVPGYMLTVATDGFSVESEPGEPRWKLLVVEDADELLLADAKERSGQALSRLLNLTDGLLGDGLRLVILLTTNVDGVRLHPALARPGRCLAKVGVDVFERDEAERWLAERGAPASAVPPGRPSLADLFEALDPRQVERDPAQAGLPGYL